MIHLCGADSVGASQYRMEDAGGAPAPRTGAPGCDGASEDHALGLQGQHVASTARHYPPSSSPQAARGRQQSPEGEYGARRRRRRTSSNTFLRPCWVSAEHSTYLTAPSSRARRSPVSALIGRSFCLASFSTTVGSSRRSICVPTIRQGTPGQWWCTSGNHFSRTFSNDAGEVTEKHTRNTSVCG